MSDALPWTALGILGAFHGVNPAMGWLFAVLRGLQERRRSAVLQALLPIALGHEASIAVVAALVLGAQFVAAPELVRAVGGTALLAYGAFRLLKPRVHPRWVGIRIGPGELFLWSFLMSSAHGAGLMLLPVLLGLSPSVEGADGAGFGLEHGGVVGGVWAVFVHTGAMLVAMAAIAFVVYEKLGVAVLRRTWLNLDLLWGGAIIIAGALTLFT